MGQLFTTLPPKAGQYQSSIGAKRDFGNCPLWVNSSLSAVYHMAGWFRPEAASNKNRLRKRVL
jgi:hypothetical protein